MANPVTSMEFLKRKAEELRKKGVGRVQGTHPIPGTKPRRVRDDNPAHKKLKLLEEEEKAKEDEEEEEEEEDKVEKEKTSKAICADWVQKAAETGFFSSCSRR